MIVHKRAIYLTVKMRLLQFPLRSSVMSPYHNGSYKKATEYTKSENIHKTRQWPYVLKKDERRTTNDNKRVCQAFSYYLKKKIKENY